MSLFLFFFFRIQCCCGGLSYFPSPFLSPPGSPRIRKALDGRVLSFFADLSQRSFSRWRSSLFSPPLNGAPYKRGTGLRMSSPSLFLFRIGPFDHLPIGGLPPPRPTNKRAPGPLPFFFFPQSCQAGASPTICARSSPSSLPPSPLPSANEA